MPALPLLLSDATRYVLDVTGAHLVVGTVSCLLIVVSVLFHYESMSRLAAFLPRIGLRRRPRIVAVILGMLLVHVIEVWIFAFAYFALDHWPELGRLQGQFEEGALDFVYFSVVTYTSLGFGDLVPHGAIRILTGCETLLGLGLITWTASFAFLEMQADWAEFRRLAPRRRGGEDERRSGGAEGDDGTAGRGDEQVGADGREDDGGDGSGGSDDDSDRAEG